MTAKQYAEICYFLGAVPMAIKKAFSATKRILPEKPVDEPRRTMQKQCRRMSPGESKQKR